MRGNKSIILVGLITSSLIELSGCNSCVLSLCTETPHILMHVHVLQLAL